MRSDHDFAGLVLVHVRPEARAEDPAAALDGQRLARDFAGRVAFRQASVTDDADFCTRFGISGPAVVLIENGRVVEQVACAEPGFPENAVLTLLARRLRPAPPDADCSDGSCRISDLGRRTS